LCEDAVADISLAASPASLPCPVIDDLGV